MAVFLLVFLHRVGVAFSEGPKLLPFYENLAKWQLLPLYAHILSVTFTVLPQTHNFVIAREAGVRAANPTRAARTPRRNFSAVGFIFPHFRSREKKRRVRVSWCDLVRHGADGS